MRYSRYISVISAIGDFILLNLLFNVAFCYFKHFDHGCLQKNVVLFSLYINLAWIITAGIFKPYSTGRETNKKQLFFIYLKSVIFMLPLFLLFFQAFPFNYFPRYQIKYLFPIFFLVVLLWRFGLYYLFLLYRKAGYNYRNVVIVGNNETGNELRDYFENNLWTGYHFKGFFTHQPSNKKDVVGSYTNLEKYVKDFDINEIYLVSSDVHPDIYKVINQIIGKYSVKIRIIPALDYFSFMSVNLTNFDTLPVIKIQEGPLMFWYNRLLKRWFDILFSMLVILLVLTWLVPVVWLTNLLTGDTGSLFFIQLRTGLDNKPFKMIKFRTMKKNREADLIQATKGDERITKIGRLLRKTSIDELPQFFNVLAGNMSVVGPRPHMLNHTAEYKEMVKKFMVRHAVKPGITGYSQVRGHRGEIKKIRDLKDRIKFDLFYIENWSFSLDMKIIYLTIINLFKGEEKAY